MGNENQIQKARQKYFSIAFFLYFTRTVRLRKKSSVLRGFNLKKIMKLLIDKH